MDGQTYRWIGSRFALATATLLVCAHAAGQTNVAADRPRRLPELVASRTTDDILPSPEIPPTDEAPLPDSAESIDAVAPAPYSLAPWSDELPAVEVNRIRPLIGPLAGQQSAPQANQSTDTQKWLNGYQARIDSSKSETTLINQAEEMHPRPDIAWWDSPVKQPSIWQGTGLSMGLDGLIDGALRHSSYVLIVSTEPKIRRASIVEEQAQFDWRGFLESKYNDFNTPVGNTLTTGNNQSRFKDQTWSLDGGFRQKNTLGGELEIAQRYGTQRNNSRFLLPNPQGTSRLELQYTQPLLNGAGRAVNESNIVLAQIQSNLSDDELSEALQEHLSKVTEAYWELYRARAACLQRRKLSDSARYILSVLEGRQQVDALRRQVLRARAAVATRQSEIVRAETSIRNAESQLRLLVNDPILLNATGQEFTPNQSPLSSELDISLGDSLTTALQNRPDISQAIRAVRASAVRLGVAENQILPKLDLVVSTYVAGLAPGPNLSKSFGDQFAEGRPSYTTGFVFEIPLSNREATARHERRQWEMTQAMGQFRLTVEQALTDVEVAVRESKTSYREMCSRFAALSAVDNEASYLLDRWNTLPGVDDSSILLLEDLLGAQERVAEEEAALVRSQVAYALSVVRLKHEMGTLLRLYPAGAEVVGP